MKSGYIVIGPSLDDITNSLSNFKQTATFILPGHKEPIILKVTKLEGTIDDGVIIVTGTITNHPTTPPLVLSYKLDSRSGETGVLDYEGLI